MGDLEKYVKEVSALKKNLVLLNKADFLTEEQRVTWAEYLTKENINFAFFSAISEEDEDIETKEDEDKDAANTEAEDGETDIVSKEIEDEETKGPDNEFIGEANNATIRKP